MTSGPRHFIVDVDNTLYNFVDYFGPTFRAALHAVAGATGIDESVIGTEFQAAFGRLETLDHNLSMLTTLPFCQALDATTRDKVQHVANVAFHGARRRRLRCYEGVLETLRWAREGGIQVVAVTNAPLNPAARRLKRLGVEHLISALVAWEGPLTDEARGKPGSWRIRIPQVWTVSAPSLKPAPGCTNWRSLSWKYPQGMP